MRNKCAHVIVQNDVCRGGDDVQNQTTKNTPLVRAIKISSSEFQFGRDDVCSDAMTFVRRRPKRNRTMVARGGDVRANHPGTPETNENSRVFSFLFLFFKT